MKAMFSVVTRGGSYASDLANHIAAWSQEALTSGKCPGFTPANSPDQADLIVFIESEKHKFPDYIHTLRANPEIQKFPERCFAYSHDDGPVGFLPGVYVSMPAWKLRPERTRSGGILEVYNLLTGEFPLDGAEPRLLFSFRGSASHRIRDRLFAMKFPELPPERYLITQTFKWFTHDEKDKQLFAREMLDSKFVLCPRGAGPASHRLFESLAAGRVPVIYSDEWAAPVGPEWKNFSVRIAESKIGDTARILLELEPHWPQMSRLARQAWDQWYSREVGPWRVLQSIADIVQSRPRGYCEADWQRRWTSFGYAWENGWTRPQRLYAAFRSGTAIQRVKDRFRSKNA